MKNVKSSIFTLCSFAALIAACEPTARFTLSGDGEGLPPLALENPINPFDNASLNPGGDASDGAGGVIPGTGNTPTQDTFTQAQVAKADLLLVIDSSGSMGNDQQALANNVNLLVTELQNAAVDYKIAVISTAADTPNALKNLCGSYITSANVSSLSGCITGVGVSGSGHEVGTEAMRRALDPQYPKGPWNLNATPAPLNADFLRPEASLHVMLMSDEEDQFEVYDLATSSWKNYGIVQDDITNLRNEMTATLADGGKPFDITFSTYPRLSNYVSFLKGLKPAGGPSVKFHAIVGTTKDQTKCKVGNSVATELGQRYQALANFTGGTVAEICQDIAPVLTSLGLQVSGLNKCFALTKVPSDQTSVTVKVDNVALASTEFSYVTTGNQVCLNDIPGAGKSIKVDYQ